MPFIPDPSRSLAHLECLKNQFSAVKIRLIVQWNLSLHSLMERNTNLFPSAYIKTKIETFFIKEAYYLNMPASFSSLIFLNVYSTNPLKSKKIKL